ncbi:phosphoribosyltransferase family protein [Nocardioides zeae]|uniref:Phosphoribosyltransferase family protein n=1 Tax=Nocardioides imazamoxiresistens TaxID=3231893 RepID=A0ABU3Q084_9ACTN|nr:phosphoribosyltransferase family protein [Nocardioides zeae]MDT9594917.1 phosphoribosyltransferase family protein [Nocardioides zeae]
MPPTDRPTDRPAATPWLRDALVDLVAGGRCVGCDRPGRLVCAGCRAGLAVPGAGPRPAFVDPRPPGLGVVWSATTHEGVARGMVVGLKERAHLALRRPLADLLAGAVLGAATEALGAAGTPRTPAAARILLCPVPPSPGSVRRRGHDPVGGVTRTAARVLRAAGHDVRLVPLLVSRGAVADQGDLGAAERVLNVRGTLWCPAAVLERARRRHGSGHVVVCDDVVTTGSTLLEARRALAAVGVQVVAGATVTSTPRRSPPTRRRPDRDRPATAG